MTVALLTAVNEVLKRVKIIQGDSFALASLTDSPKQNYIDIAVQVWNEAIDQLYSRTDQPRPNIMGTTLITLVLNQRNYPMNSGLVKLHFPLIDETNGQYISEYPGGFLDLINSQPIPNNYKGLPTLAAISPIDNDLYMDVAPTADHVGKVYKIYWEKDTVVSLAADILPFNANVFRAMVPAVSQLWLRDQRRDFDSSGYRKSIGRAARLLTQLPANDQWTPIRYNISEANITDPFDGD